MKYIFRLGVAISFIALVTGCVGIYYKEAASKEPHALIQFQKKKGSLLTGFGRMAVSPLEINGMPLNKHFKLSRDYRVHPGKVSVLTHAPLSGGLMAIGFVKFEAVSGDVYKISRILNEKNVEFNVTNSEGVVVASASADKQPANQNTYVPVYVPVE